jgi:hypothetical protein
MTKELYYVELWRNGDEYEEDTPPNYTTAVLANNSEEAGERAEREYGCTCDVWYAEKLDG